MYADWLAERGDPRGELIGLDLSAAEQPDNVELAASRDQLAKRVHETVFGDLWRIGKLLVESPLAASLESVAIWVGNPSRVDYELLVEHRGYFTRLRDIRVPSKSYTQRLSG